MKFTAAISENLRRLAWLARTLGLCSASHTFTLWRKLGIVRKNYRRRVAMITEEFKAGFLVVLGGIHYLATLGFHVITGHIPGFQAFA